MKYSIYVIVALSMLLETSGVLANVGPVFIAGEQIEANTSTDVVLERETIEVILSPMSARVVCNFYLRNTGEMERLTLAFPGKDGQEGDIQNRTMKDFVVSINGQQIPTTYQHQFKRSSHTLIHGVSERYGWYTWEHIFPADEQVHIRISYTALNHNFGFTYNPYGDFVYILATGSLWKDSVQRIDVVVRFAEMDICQITDFAPQTGTINLDKSLTWHFEDVEPTWDSNIYIWYEIDLFEPNPVFGYPETLTKFDPHDIQEMLVRLDFQTFEHLVSNAIEPTPVPGENIGFTMFLRDSLLNAGKVLEAQQEWHKAVQLYRWYKDTFGDIRSDLRPYSILYLRLAECYKHIGDRARAIAFFQASMDTEPMTKERYFQGLFNMFNVDAYRVQKHTPFRSKKSEQWKHYFYSKGLNEYCQRNIHALSRQK